MALAENHLFLGFLRHPGLRNIIAAEPADVLPRLPFWAITEAFRWLPEDEINFALRHKILPVADQRGAAFYACFGAESRNLAQRLGLRLVAEAEPNDFLRAARHVLGARLVRAATHRLAGRLPGFSARRRLSAAQSVSALVAAASCAVAAWFLSLHTLWAAASLAGGLFFLSIIALRFLCLMPPGPHSSAYRRPLTGGELPVYSVLVPLFRETAVLDQLLNALVRLRYPALCIKRTKQAPS